MILVRGVVGAPRARQTVSLGPSHPQCILLEPDPKLVSAVLSHFSEFVRKGHHGTRTE